MFDSYKKNNKYLSCFEYLIICTIGLGFSFVLMALLDYLGILTFITGFLCFLTSFVVVYFFVDFFGLFINLPTPFIIVIVALLCFLPPTLLTIQIKNNEQSYLTSHPNGDKVAVKIDCSVSSIESSGSLGGEWRYEHSINAIPFESGDTVEISSTSPFTISSILTEIDGIDDIGKGSTGLYRYTDYKLYSGEYTIKQKIRVDEHGGRKNNGAYRIFEITYVMNRKLPSSVSKSQLLMMSPSSTLNVLKTAQISSLLVLFSVPVLGYIVGKHKENENKIKKEEQNRLEKEAFLQEISRKTIRELVNIPQYYEMVNGLPVDNNNQLYGSLTVYISKSGTHFHLKKGCCSASTPIHLYRALEKYTPCSKCTPSHLAIPQWFKDYEELMRKAKKYGIEIEE